MLPIPWAHVALPEHIVLAWRNHLTSRKAACWSDLGLNELPLAEYLRLFRGSGMEIVQLEINASKRFVSHMFSLFRELPHCEEFFSHNIYVILEKGAGMVSEPESH